MNKKADEEIERLRREQARKVMPKIGSLLDEWELLPNDIKSDPGIKSFSKAIEEIFRAME